jgi:Mitochondrial DNA-directed RNA polymerase
MDGSCSGLQHYSALLLDEVGGAAVNLVPGDTPSDIYTMVADRAQVLSDGSLGGTNDYMARAWRGKVCRKVAKQPTMTLCYSATKFGMKGQIENALHKLDEDGPPYLPEGVDRYKAAIYMSEIIWDALGDTVVAARRAMDWLKRVSDVAVEAGLPIRWTSPIGLPVMQDYRERIGSIVKVFVGGQPIQLFLKADSDSLSKRRQASGIAPNFVHSLDAAHLLSTVNLGVANGLGHFAMIHDSFGVHAADTSLLNAVLRESFVAQYSEPVLARFREEIVEQLEFSAPELVKKIPPVPRQGNLDLDAVKRSEFFFA